MSVNVTATNFQDADFAEQVLVSLQARALPAELLELELTESAFLADTGGAKRQMEQLTEAGITLAIDDFGTGYSSLSYLQSIPAQVLKVDQSFVRDVLDDERKQTLVASTISLAHSLGYRVVAEGVETRGVAAMLAQASCDEGQGYLWGRPMGARDILRLSTEVPALAA